MASLDRFERLMERVVEGSVGRVFRSQVQPAEIGRRLEQAMEARPLVSVNGTIVPNDYRVHLNPEDAASFLPMQQGLCEEFARWLGEIGGERGYRFMGPIAVSLISDANVARRDVQVQAVAQSPYPSQPPPPPPLASAPQGQLPPYPFNNPAPYQQAPQAPQEPLYQSPQSPSPQYQAPQSQYQASPPGSFAAPPRQAPPPPTAPAPPRDGEAFTVRRRQSEDMHDRETKLGGQRGGMIAPIAGTPPPVPTTTLPKGVVAYFALRTLTGERTFPLRFSDATMGRALDNDIVLESNDVSRRHARLEPAGSVLRLVDLGSTNGTRVNGRRVQDHLLREGDLVELGSVQLAFHVGDPEGH